MEEPTFSVAELSAGIARALQRTFPEEVWVRGEIRDLNRAASGHVYFSLVDPDEAAVPATLPVTLFATDRRAVNRLLVRSGALRMTDGVEVRIRGSVGLHEARGTIRLRMTWIDTDFTIGRLAADRERLLRRLAAESLIERNRGLPFPLVPLRVGLVTSVGSAAHADFLEELRASSYAWSVTEVDARVQGREAASSLIEAIEALGRGVDVVALVRGGGAASDLAAFDDEGVARAVATAPVPVVTGVGHEVDTTVADRVAAVAFKTPTACAAGLVARVSEFVATLDGFGARIAAAANGRIGRHRSLLAGRTQRIALAVSTSLRRAALDLGQLEWQTRALPVRVMEQATAKLEGAHRLASARDPQRLFAQGWSITRDETGAIVQSVEAVHDGDAIVTTVGDGNIASVVTVAAAGPAGDGGAGAGP